MNVIRKVSTLFKYISLYSFPEPWSIQKPVVIQFPINDICNARCQMCNIWQQKYDYQISPQELRVALSNSLYTEVRGVGVNGGEPTLRKDVAEIVDVLFECLPKLSSIALITNALNSSQAIERIHQIGEVIQNRGGKLDVMVSLDGVGDVHDRVRGRKGNFENAVRVIDFIKSSPLVSSNRLGCTVIKENVFGIEDLLEFALEKNIYIKYRLGIPHQRLYSHDVHDPFALDYGEKYHLSIFLENLITHYEESELQKYFYKSLIGQIMYGKSRTSGCDWKHRGVTLTARGELMYCAVESNILGSAISEDSSQLYFDNEHHLKEIISNKCDSCNHDYVGLPSRDIFVGFMKSSIKRRLKNISGNPTLRLAQPLLNIRQDILFSRRLSSFNLNFKDLDEHLRKVKSYCWDTDANRKKKILVCGWYGTETLGDKAILGGVISSIREVIPNIEVHLASLEPYISEMTISQMPELEGCQVYTVSESMSLIAGMDMVVFGGGPLMAISPIADMLSIFREASIRHIPTLIAGCGIGPLGSEIYNQAIRYLLLYSSFRIYRDYRSKELAEFLGIDTAKDEVAEDPAFTWINKYRLPETRESELQLESQPDSPRKLILGLRDWPYKEYARHLSVEEGEHLKNKYESSVIEALEKLIIAFPDLKIVPFPMCTNHIGNDDRWFYRRLFRGNAKLASFLDLSYLGKEIPPLEAIQVFRQSSVALTMRFHSLVFALSVGLPTISIDYTLGAGKVASLAKKYKVMNIELQSIDSNTIYASLATILGSDSHPLTAIRKEPIDIKFDSAIRKFVQNLHSQSMTK
jgi:polysaccharide pyruvyl transferase WcaK-like protein/sulfatase maturation enzyme AslB (radical SAM superfamily)